MFRLIGIIAVITVVSGLICLVSYTSGSSFIIKFSTEQSLQIMATALALNVATISFITGNFLSIEHKTKTPIFNETRKELRHNILFMVVLFVISFIVVSGVGTDISVAGVKVSDVLAIASTFLTVFFGALIVEISMLILKNNR